MGGRRFTHLHVHSGYSLLDGGARAEQLAQRARDLGFDALALTDHGNLFGAVEFYDACQKHAIKPILGMEAYFTLGSRTERTREKRNHHLILLCKNRKGFQNLVKLSSLSFLDGFYYKPRLDFDLLERYGEGLIATSACIAGPLAPLLLADDMLGAQELLRRFQGVFGDDGFFLELQNHGIEEQRRINHGLMALAGRSGAPLVCTNDIHYVDKGDSFAHDCLICLSTRETLSSPKRLRYESEQFAMAPYEEMLTLFPDCREAVDNTGYVADRCNLELDYASEPYHVPHFECPDGKHDAGYLRERCLEGLQRRYGTQDGAPRQRLEYELQVIEAMHFASYFLIVWDFVNHARSHGIPVGPGRGSAAGSIVAYCLGITEVDPLRFDLLFERFLNPSRREMPDIDIDFCKDGREEVIRYVKEKYGADNVCQIITFGTLGSKLVLRDVGRVLEIDLHKTDRLAKKVPMKGAVPHKLADAPAVDPDFKAMIDGDDDCRRVYDIATRLEGLPRHVGTHAAGIVIADRPLMELVPLYKSDEGVSTQWEMSIIGRIKLLKMDFLGLNNLTIIARCRALIEAEHAVTITFDDRYDDPATFELLARGDTKGVFQSESSGMRELFVRMKPNRFGDIVAVIALHRPGPLGAGMDAAYVARKHGRERVSYLDERLAEILEDTYGVIIYQEQVMLIAHKLAGFSLADADGLRKAMGKKKPEQMAKYRDQFFQGAAQRRMQPSVIETLWEQMAFFAQYGFNKSHSVAYAVLTYQTAYLKAHYPVEYMATVLTENISKSERVVEYIEECRRMGIEVLPPDVNESRDGFTPVGGNIRFGLSACKGVGSKAAEAILKARARHGLFTGFFDFCENIDPQAVHKTVAQVLVKCGAFDRFGVPRRALYDASERALDMGARARHDREIGQTSIFGDSAAKPDDAALLGKKPKEWAEHERLALEKEALGFWISSHPLAQCESDLKRFTSCAIRDLEQAAPDAEVVLGGVIQRVATRITQSGRNQGKKWAVLALEDLTDVCEVAVYARQYGECAPLLETDRIIFVRGHVDKQRDTARVIAEEITPLSQVRRKYTRLVQVTLNVRAVDEAMLRGLDELFARHRGGCELRLKFVTPEHPRAVYLYPPASKYRVEYCETLRREIEALLGDGHLQISASRSGAC